MERRWSTTLDSFFATKPKPPQTDEVPEDAEKTEEMEETEELEDKFEISIQEPVEEAQSNVEIEERNQGHKRFRTQTLFEVSGKLTKLEDEIERLMKEVENATLHGHLEDATLLRD